MAMSPDASEVVMYAENDHGLYDVLMKTYLPNLEKKVKKGVYDRTLALKLMEYYYQNYIRPWMKKPQNAGYDPNLDKKDRADVAEYFLDYLEKETDLLKGAPKTESIRESLSVDKSDPKNIDTGVSNIFLKGCGYDGNGNLRIIVGFPNDKGISLQTADGLPKTDSILSSNGGRYAKISKLSDDDIQSIGREVTEFIKAHGSGDKKKRVQTYESKMIDKSKRRKLTEAGESGGLQLDQVINQYVGTALWAENDDDDTPLENNYDVSDIDDASMKQMQGDCTNFMQEVEKAGLMQPYVTAYSNDITNASQQFGHDFWLTRNGHGAGFWDRTELDDDDLGKKISAIADKFRECYLYVGDDGKLHIG